MHFADLLKSQLFHQDHPEIPTQGRCLYVCQEGFLDYEGIVLQRTGRPYFVQGAACHKPILHTWEIL